MNPTKKNIWAFKQNKPSLIVRDITEKYPSIPPDFIYSILLKRGVFKWLAVRRDLIILKNIWRDTITNTIISIREEKGKIEADIKYRRPTNYNNLYYLRGYLKAIENNRKEIRKLCHSDRWRAPDFDKGANEYLREVEK